MLKKPLLAEGKHGMSTLHVQDVGRLEVAVCDLHQIIIPKDPPSQGSRAKKQNNYVLRQRLKSNSRGGTKS